MTIKTWQKIAGTAAVMLGMGMLGNAAHAGSRDCGGTTPDPGCYTWTFDSTGDIAGVNGQPGNTINASASGWANTSGTNGASNTLLQSAYVVSYGGGLGVTNKDCNANYGAGACNTGTGEGGDSYEGSLSTGNGTRPPEHAVDNSDRFDSILFNFGSTEVNLTTFSAGYVYGDSDFTVLAYAGDDGALNQTNPAGLTYAGLLTSGWKLIGNYAAGSSTGSHDFANDTSSSLWMIGALNTLTGIGGVQDGKIDAFKILSVAGCVVPPKGAPEPGTLLLMGAGLLGLTRYSRRRLVRAA